MKIGFIGCGNMGGALARAVAKNKDVTVLIADRDAAKVARLQEEISCAAATAEEIAAECDYIYLGVKPHLVKEVLGELKGAFGSNPTGVLVSMAAGVTLDTLEGCLYAPHPVIRIMPNTPAAVGEGMTVYARNGAVSEAQEQEFLRIMAPTGKVDALPESQINAATAIMGCGPAFAYIFAEALADGGVLCGLPRDKAILYAAQTMRGASQMILSTGKHPDLLKDEVCSPGGSTIEGVRALEEGAFRATAMSAVIAAWEKNKKLG